MFSPKVYFFTLGVIALFTACKKKDATVQPVLQPPMQYIDLHDATVQFGRYITLDLDKDKATDIVFGTQLVGDPIEKVDKAQWLVSSSFYTSLLINDREELPLLQLQDSIPVGNLPVYNWYNAGSIVLVQKIQTLIGNTHWDGVWKQANHHYVAFQLNKQDHIINGWIEVSFDPAKEQLILHKAGVSQEKNRTIMAGK
jgi:hypothetical protein